LAETPRPESEERLADYVAGSLHWNQFRKAIKLLKTLNLVVVKPEPGGRDTIELHPLIREFIRTEYSPKDREKFIGIICKVFDRIILKFKPQLRQLPSYSILEHWTLRAELALNRRDYKEALEYLYDAASPLIEKGYVEEFVRVGSRIFRELDWTEALLTKYPYFELMIGQVSMQLSHLGRYAEADELAERYEKVIIGKSARFIHLCQIRSYSYWLRGRYDSAKEWGRRGVELKQSAHVDTEFDCAHNLALAQRDSGEVEPALKYFLQDQTIDELLQRTEKNDTRPSHVFGNIGRCLCLKGDIKNALRCVRKSAVMLDTETGSNVLVNQGWAALWLGELFETSGKLDLAYCFFKRAESKWESSSPINAKLSRTRSDKVFDELAKVTSFKLPSDAEIEERCRKLLERGEDVSV
jgi:tetratricopeptide (TPR) repeat protein